MRRVGDPADSVCQLLSCEQPVWLYNLALAMDPLLGLYWVEPRTHAGEVLHLRLVVSQNILM
jgi:hypothetical protein